jgi:signal transduction histidine kinase
VIGKDASSAATEAESGPSGLIDHIQSVMEHQKALLARELHDELGGLLVGAVMDLAWAEQHLSAPPAELRQKLIRARQTLASAIDLKRKLIEDLRPTLLDNVGLFAALRWHVQAASKRAGFGCRVTVPDEERRFLPHIPIVLFRIVQEALAVIVARKPSADAEFAIQMIADTLTVEVRGATDSPPKGDGAGTDTHYLAAIQQRVVSLGGKFGSVYDPRGVTVITAKFPIDGILASA